MKNLFMSFMLLGVALSAFGETTKTTTTQMYESETEKGTGSSSILEDEAIEEDTLPEVQEYDEEEIQEMEEKDLQDDEYIDYNDRTRTNRERKALNTGGNASDDK